MIRILIVDAYPKEGRQSLRDAGGSEAGDLYRALLSRIATGLETEIQADVLHPADGELPAASELSHWDGVVWTGSNLSILDADDPGVSRQVDLVRDLLDAGVPNFGSCFAVQLAATARGGRCAANPKGREFGIAREIHVSAAGRAHPLYRDKPDTFDAFTSHADHVVALPPKATLLSENAWSPVQGAAYENPRDGSFWAVQYHPEYDLREVASLARLRERELIAQGTFADETAARAWIDGMETLHADAKREDLATELGIGPTLQDPRLRTLEVRNWLVARVLA